jgi:hypothetical protein
VTAQCCNNIKVLTIQRRTDINIELTDTSECSEVKKGEQKQLLPSHRVHAYNYKQTRVFTSRDVRNKEDIRVRGKLLKKKKPEYEKSHLFMVRGKRSDLPNANNKANSRELLENTFFGFPHVGWRDVGEFCDGPRVYQDYAICSLSAPPWQHLV